MPSARTIIKIRTIIITFTLLVGIFILSYLNGIDIQSGSFINYLITEDDYMDDEPELMGSRSDTFLEYIKKEGNVDTQTFLYYIDLIAVNVSFFIPFIDTIVQTLSGPHKIEFFSIFYDYLSSTDYYTVDGQPSFYRCKSQ